MKHKEDEVQSHQEQQDFPEEYQQLLSDLSAEAVIELEQSAAPFSLKTRFKRTFWKIAGHPPAVRDPIFWPAGILLLGLWEAGRQQEVRDFLDDWIGNGMRVVRVDDALTGYVLLRVYEKDWQAVQEKNQQDIPDKKKGSRDEKAARDDPDAVETNVRQSRYRQAADAVWTFLQNAPKDKNGCLTYYPDHGSQAVFADGIGQSVLFLSLYDRLFHVPAAGKMAQDQLLFFCEKAIDRNTGLLYHGYDPQTGVRQGIIGWGRAMGWILMGLSEYVCALSEHTPARKDRHPGDEDRLLLLFRQLSSNTLRYLRKDHLFSWQLECMDGPSDTSATGMIAWALLHATRDGVDTGFSNDMEIEILNALTEQVNGGKMFGSSAECIDFSEYPQRYGNNPWGQGAALAYIGQSLNGSNRSNHYADH